jgi:hypothetical protein
MKTRIVLNADGDTVLLIPDCPADSKAVGMLSSLPGASIVRRVVAEKHTKETRTCILFKIGHERDEAPLFSVEVEGE